MKPCSSQTLLLYSRIYLPEKRPEGSFKENNIRGDQSPRGPRPVNPFTQDVNEQHQAFQVTRAPRARTGAFRIPASPSFFPFFTNKTHDLSLTFYPTFHYKTFEHIKEVQSTTPHTTILQLPQPPAHHRSCLLSIPTYSPSPST